MTLYEEALTDEEALIFNGKTFTADEVYQRIYHRARSRIMVVDDYISTKTLHHLVHAKANVKIVVVSDNRGSVRLRKAEFEDFAAEYPSINISLLQSQGKMHDRYIVLDWGTKNMRVYHCGASSKDAGKRTTTISEMKDIEQYKPLVKSLLDNPLLELK